MDENFVERARKRVQELTREEAALAAQEEGVRRKREEVRGERERIENAVEVFAGLMNVGTATVEVAPENGLFDNLPLGSITEMAADVVVRKGGQASVADIIDALIRVGKLKDDGGTRRNYGNVYSTLRKSRRFRKSDRGVFTLAPTHG